MVRSSRSRVVAGCALAAAIAASAPLSAHRRDEYLQAARLAIDPGRVEIELDLTPGISVADGVLGQIDTDGDGSVSSIEADAYVVEVLRAITLQVDGRRLSARAVDRVLPAVDAVRRGEGTIRLRIAAPLPALPPGTHHLRFANAHRPDIGVYLANALVPASPAVSISDQRRDFLQREIDVAYVLRAGPADISAGAWPVAGAVALGITLALWLGSGTYLTNRERARRSSHANGANREARGERERV